jgi:tetratricopeptide (TPR) repeat protein
MLASKLGDVAEKGHATLAEHYALADGAVSPRGLPNEQLSAWCEKAHHLGRAGELKRTEWEKLDLVSPSLYWERGRHLSQVLRHFSDAAEVYQRCVERFPEDDYGWHYLGYNLQRAKRSEHEVRRAFTKAVELNPEHPWWNGRLVTSLIRSGHPREAKVEWHRAITRIDPDGTQLRASPYLATNLHLWVARAWLAAGRHAFAKDTLEPVPQRFLKQPPLIQLKRRLDQGQTQWSRYLDQLTTQNDVTPEMIRTWWDRLLETEPHLPPPMADLTADKKRFQFAWSYDSVFVEFEIEPDGSAYWYALSREKAQSEDGELNRGGAVDSTLRSWLTQVANA